MPLEKEALVSKHREQLKMLAELSLRLKDVVNAGNVHKETLKIIQSRFHYYYISLWTVGADGTATLQAHEGAYANFLQPGFQLKGEGIIGHVIATGKSYLSNDISTDRNFTSLKLPVETKSALAVPIFDAEDKLAGVLNVEAAEANAFNEDDLNVMEGIGAQVTLSLSNAGLYNQVSEFNKQLQNLVEEKTQELRAAHQKILDQQKLLQKENRALKTIVNRSSGEREIIGQSAAVASLLSMVDKIAPTRVSVLIQGESGTGKELVAHRIHRMSDRVEKPFVTINCGALQESLLESELFGHEKGSFTGAVAQKIGLAETADGGTLFLDEIGEMSLSIQTKLLRFLQEGEMYRIGGKQPIRVDVRVLSATNRDLEQEVKGGRFREDLFYRLNTITLRMPPLRKRPEDVALLIRHFLDKSGFGSARQLTISARALEAMTKYAWPGNIRELQNTMEQLKVLAEGPEIKLEDLPFNIRMAQSASPNGSHASSGEALIPLTLDDLEKNHILQMLAYHHGNKTKTAKILGITIKTLYNKLHRYGMLDGDVVNNNNVQ
ncbi:MAG: sigma-54-dependent Fis family transcriptional regulator [Bdellovibrionales bacterium]|nr:sigma-54-dependent Fis family transcriptional regulator [Bdellovibrionales bacterium]